MDIAVGWLTTRLSVSGPVLLIISMTIATWTLGLEGLRDKKIRVSGRFEVSGKKAIFLSRFWIFMAILLTVASIRALYILIVAPNIFN